MLADLDYEDNDTDTDCWIAMWFQFLCYLVPATLIRTQATSHIRLFSAYLVIRYCEATTILCIWPPSNHPTMLCIITSVSVLNADISQHLSTCFFQRCLRIFAESSWHHISLFSWDAIVILLSK